MHAFLLGFLVEKTPCEHGENMQTPHRKAREIAHLSTVHSGEDLPPRANSAPCGNRTHDFLAVRRQCKQCTQLSHRATVQQYYYQHIVLLRLRSDQKKNPRLYACNVLKFAQYKYI